MQRAEFIEPPARFIDHTEARDFIGPAVVRLEDGALLMAVNWARPPTDFSRVERDEPCPKLYRSSDGGRSWEPLGQVPAGWNVGGAASDGGCSFLHLQDGRLALAVHRHVAYLHGGGLPTITFSKDEGKTWEDFRLIGAAQEGAYYIMNDRLIQMRDGRLVLAVSYMPPWLGKAEGDTNVALAFYSDDGGAAWKASDQWAQSPFPDGRGMDEPCVAELTDGRLLMLARSGNGWLMESRSEDAGRTWSEPRRTALPSPCSSLTMRALPGGRLVVLYNHASPLRPGAFFPRNPLVYAVSDDSGQSWSPPVLIDDEANVWTEPGVAPERDGQQHIYPCICLTGEGMLVVYSSHFSKRQGRFGGGGEDAWRVGGGKRCIIAGPA